MFNYAGAGEKMRATVRVPATIANLGCGFDCFGLALPIYNTVSIQETVLPGSGIEINIYNENDNEENIANIPTDKNNIVYQAIELLYNFIGQSPAELKIDISTQIPVARGLGSSASVVVGGLMAANELLGRPADKAVITSIATEIEGHPDNVIPAVYGGVNLSSWEDDGSVVHSQLPWHNDWKITVCIPDYELATDISRSVLPENVQLKDAIFNLRRTAMFVSALYSKDEELLKLSLKDRLHQPYRTKLVPGLNSIMKNLKHTDGVFGSALSGAGPSIVVFSKKESLDEIKEIVTKTWEDINVKAEIHTLALETHGAQVL